MCPELEEARNLIATSFRDNIMPQRRRRYGSEGTGFEKFYREMMDFVSFLVKRGITYEIQS
ncbi:MAG: hypothetical protein AMS17_20815 [Spirochaetes bacterium DG_61]|nr:MAG: hypothetical protein AMS17_20815 [Spirochaetes bacterium DG_61]